MEREIVDPCRQCRGTGVQTYPTERGTFLTEECDLCQGTGSRVFITRQVNTGQSRPVGVEGSARPPGTGPSTSPYDLAILRAKFDSESG